VVRNESNRPEKVQEVIQIVRQSGGIEYATQAMYQYRQQAFDILENYAPSDAKQALKNLLVYVTERKR
jgi:octaprenyl-diphosphate synthase